MSAPVTAVPTVEVEPKWEMLDPATPESKAISGAMVWYSPAFSPKAVPRFYDAGSLTENPKIFQLVVDVMVRRYQAMAEGERPTHVLGYDARGFLLGAPIALGLGIPFVMLRKKDKSPGVLVRSDAYSKEYAEHEPDTMVLRDNSIDRFSRVILIDDLIATGGTAVSGFQLVQAIGAKIVEFAAVIGIPFCKGVEYIHSCYGGAFKDIRVFTLIHDDFITAEQCGDPKVWPEGKSRVLGLDEVATHVPTPQAASFSISDKSKSFPSE
jgi:adenine phosphoribosyltransferase